MKHLFLLLLASLLITSCSTGAGGERTAEQAVHAFLEHRAAERGGQYTAGTFETHVTYGTDPDHAPSYQVWHAYVMTTSKGENMQLVGAFVVDSVLQVTAPAGMGY